MALKEALLAVVVGLPAPWYGQNRQPETDEQYRERVQIIAEAITLEAERSKAWPHGVAGLAIATLTLWEAESSLSYDVHANTGNDPWGQDHGKARCLGQLHSSRLVPKEEWETLAGADLEATRRCANATMRVLRAQYRVCQKRGAPGDPIANMYEIYANGRSCTPKARSLRRARRYRQLMNQFYVEQNKQKRDEPNG